MLTNKRIVLTGANSGIGLEVLKLLAAGEGNKILAVDLSLSELNAFGENVVKLQCDVSTRENVDLIFKRAVEALGGIDIFYANAGYPYYEKIDYVDWDRAVRLFETNVFSPIYTYEKYIEYLAGRPGHYAMTVSAIGKMAMPGFTVYSASKFALHGFQQGVRFEMPENLTLTCLYPIATDTNFFKAANERDFERPFPVQSPKVVARKMVKGLERGKKTVAPSPLFSISMVLFAVAPFTKAIYLSLEKAKFHRFLKNSK